PSLAGEAKTVGRPLDLLAHRRKTKLLSPAARIGDRVGAFELDRSPLALERQREDANLHVERIDGREIALELRGLGSASDLAHALQRADILTRPGARIIFEPAAHVRFREGAHRSRR